jgi:hypothetical protein
MTLGAPQSLRADLLVASEMSAVDCEVLATALASYDLTVVTKVVRPRRGAETLQWLVLLALPLQAFLSAVGEKAAHDAYEGLHSAFRRVLRGDAAEASTRRRQIVLQDVRTGLEVVLAPDLPPEAYRRLFELSLTDFRRGPVHYDHHERRWRSISDEIAPP